MFDLETCVGIITNRVSKQMAEAFNERLTPLGVTRVQWIALYYLGLNEGMSQKELAEKMDIKDSTVARLVDRLERDELVERIKDDSDRRVFKLVLSEKGRKTHEELLPEGEKMSRIFAKDISKEDIEVFKRVLKKILDNINEG